MLDKLYKRGQLIQTDGKDPTGFSSSLGGNKCVVNFFWPSKKSKQKKTEIKVFLLNVKRLKCNFFQEHASEKNYFFHKKP